VHRVAVAVAVALTFVTPTTQAQENQWRDQVERQLENASKRLSDRGYDQTHETQIGSLRDDENESFSLTLHSGTSYALVGVWQRLRDLSAVTPRRPGRFGRPDRRCADRAGHAE
jgi:hypothetical protein